ncbi:MAG TPA: hypothetical protein VM689_12260 [Aliidongia sp.]|nr:hypothetical protein [Aliidongia sp.]
MDKDSFILQTTRPGRLPTKAVFVEERTARAETDRAIESGAFEHVLLLVMNGTERKVLVDMNMTGGGKVKGKGADSTKPGKGKGVSGATRVTTTQIIHRFTALLAVALIVGVMIYLAQPYLN